MNPIQLSFCIFNHNNDNNNDNINNIDIYTTINKFNDNNKLHIKLNLLDENKLFVDNYNKYIDY